MIYLNILGYLSPPTTKVTEVGKNYFKVNISITALDNICKRKNEKIEFILLHSEIKSTLFIIICLLRFLKVYISSSFSAEYTCIYLNLLGFFFYKTN